MSLITCDICGGYIDSDEDPDCFNPQYEPETGELLCTMIECELCRTDETFMD